MVLGWSSGAGRVRSQVGMGELCSESEVSSSFSELQQGGLAAPEFEIHRLREA